ncbi:hypothetical protein Ahy_A01g004436 [Arachis hypogaea]|uniref:Uncharacterized protein n=1 Tax=Arachis hypogaea TaxID=3818 RepID=A0A445EW24_ARAHY|nr:hypothetical protein Ahy_A01g004436 [Arachis hypogaea]
MGDDERRCNGRNHLTSWIRPAIKKDLEPYFTHDDKGFKHHHLTNVANRVSPRLSKYTGGSPTFMKTKSRLVRILSFLSRDREATLADTFNYTHSLKANKERFAHKQRQPII